MKTLVSLTLLAILSAPAFGQELVKSCTADLLDFDTEEVVTTKILVSKKADGTLESLMSYQNAPSQTVKDIATVTNYAIRPDLKQEDIMKDSFDNLNDGEMLIVHAMALTEDPEMEGKFSAGMKLKDIRSVKVYKIGKQTKWGMIAIVEAKNAQGKDMGSFFGGFLVAPCK